MEDQTETTYITNTLTYLYLLPEDEQSNKLNKISAYFKKKQRKYNKGSDYNPEHEKSLKRIIHLTFKNLRNIDFTPYFNKYTGLKGIRANILLYIYTFNINR